MTVTNHEQNRDLRWRGFTIVELLVVIAIIGVLIAMLLPAIQGAREAARRNRCDNNMRQMGLGVINHVTQHGHFPTGGWGARWVGVPGRGSSVRQPGGWIYNILPYVEEQHLHDLGINGDEEARRAASAQRLQTPLSLFTCPTRRPVQVWPTVDYAPHLRNPRLTNTVHFVARADYAINGGSEVVTYSSNGPDDLSDHAFAEYPWPNAHGFNGVCFLISEVTAKRIKDGLGKTLLVAEKSLSPERYHSGVDPGDNESMYSGFCVDLNRFANREIPPRHDRDDHLIALPYQFGSAHPTSWGAVFCDGSVRHIGYGVDLSIHESLANRDDGVHVGLRKLE